MPAHPSPGLRKAETALASSVACWAPDAMARAEGPALPGPWPGLLEPKTAGARRPGWGPLPPSLSGPGSASLDPKGCVGHLHNRGAAASFPLFISACCFILWVSGNCVPETQSELAVCSQGRDCTGQGAVWNLTDFVLLRGK